MKKIITFIITMVLLLVVTDFGLNGCGSAEISLPELDDTESEHNKMLIESAKKTGMDYLYIPIMLGIKPSTGLSNGINVAYPRYYEITDVI